MIDPSKLPLLNRLSETQYQAAAYLVAGAWNTVFGVGIYTLAYYFTGKYIHYMILAVICNILAVTNAFLCYKLFVFRTRGNWLKEYLKCYTVYGAGALCGMGLLWFLTAFFKLNPMLSNLLSTAIVAIASFFGHKYFSFK